MRALFPSRRVRRGSTSRRFRPLTFRFQTPSTLCHDDSGLWRPAYFRRGLCGQVKQNKSAISSSKWGWGLLLLRTLCALGGTTSQDARAKAYPMAFAPPHSLTCHSIRRFVNEKLRSWRERTRRGRFVSFDCLWSEGQHDADSVKEHVSKSAVAILTESPGQTQCSRLGPANSVRSLRHALDWVLPGCDLTEYMRQQVDGVGPDNELKTGYPPSCREGILHSL